VRAASKRTIRKKCIYNTTSIDHIEHSYNIVTSHLRRNNTLTKTYAKFPPRAIYAAVKRFLEQSPSEPLDIAVTFETLRDFETVADFLESLEAEHTITKGYTNESLEEYALKELTEKAQILGKQIVNKNEVILSQNEYSWLKLCERNWKKINRKADGWPLSLS
jgi:hypothetical protein